MSETELHIGDIIEQLIRVKDRTRSYLTSLEIDSINAACNILYHMFNNNDTPEYIIDRNIGKVYWKTDDIHDRLIERGYSGSDENVQLVIEDYRFEKTLEEMSISGGWDAIDNAISNVRRQLEVSTMLGGNDDADTDEYDTDSKPDEGTDG